METLEYDNIFDAICDTPEEDNECLKKSNCLSEIRDSIEKFDLDHHDLMAILSIDKDVACELIEYKITHFNSDQLQNYQNILAML